MTPQELIVAAFHDISEVAFDSDSTRDPVATLNRICSVIYSTEQCLDNATQEANLTSHSLCAE